MEIRQGTTADLAAIMAVLEQSVVYFREQGIDQWQEGYPNEEVVVNDIAAGQSYLLQDQQVIRGVMVVMTTPDPNYDHLDCGQWRYDEPYGTVHRIAINKEYPGTGLAQVMLEAAEEIAMSQGCQVMRIDTHNDNTGMQHVLKKMGYQLIGELTLPDGGKRIALDKKIKK